jgi:hypothetical protein
MSKFNAKGNSAAEIKMKTAPAIETLVKSLGMKDRAKTCKFLNADGFCIRCGRSCPGK